MAEAVICPVCRGEGVTPTGKQCHGCDGKGWVQVYG